MNKYSKVQYISQGTRQHQYEKNVISGLHVKSCQIWQSEMVQFEFHTHTNLNENKSCENNTYNNINTNNTDKGDRNMKLFMMVNSTIITCDCR